MNPKTMPLKEIHKGNSRKHIMIALVGVDHYLEMCKEWKPDVKGKFNKFQHFSDMVVAGDDQIEESYRKKGWGHRYVDKPHIVDFYNGSINGKYGLIIKNRDYNELHHFPLRKELFKTNHWNLLFEKHDRELWDLLNIREMSSRGLHKFNASFQNGVFSLKGDRVYEGHPPLYHDVAPAWFKAKIFLGQDAFYENEELGYKVMYRHETKEIGFDGIEYDQKNRGRPANETKLVCRDSLFHGNTNLPCYNFDLDLSSDSWEGLLEKWSRLAFNWLGMHEDSHQFR